MRRTEEVGVGLLGLGVVGGGVAKVLLQKGDSLAEQTGCALRLRRILVRSPEKPRSVEVDPRIITTNPADVLNDPSVGIIVELVGGEQPALSFIQEALRRGKHVITANKEVMAKHGPELLVLAEKHSVGVFYEGSVGGGIPILNPLRQELLANAISTIYAIINGTTNYILTRMAQENLDFSTALRLAQELGYAESNPANDIEGVDAAYKLAVLCTIAFRAVVRPGDVFHEGISNLRERDFRYARELGYAIKLLAIGKEQDGVIEARVHPALVPEDFILARVDGVYNAVIVDGDLTGRLLFYGRGAGDMPTSSAVVSDIIAAAQRVRSGQQSSTWLTLPSPKPIKPMSDVQTRYYMRMSVADQPGMLAQIASILGAHGISISAVIQKEADAETQTAELVIMTHPAREAAVQRALGLVKELSLVREIGNFIRVEA